MNVPHAKVDNSWLSQWRNVFTCSSAALLMAGFTACTAHGNAAQSGIGFSCAVIGEKFVPADLNAAAVCALFKAKIDEALSHETFVASSKTKEEKDDRIELNIRFTKLGSIVTTFAEQNGSYNKVYPEIAVDVSDGPIGKDDVDKLAAEVAKLIAETRSNHGRRVKDNRQS